MKIRSLITNAALTAICLILVIPIIVYAFPILAGADGSYTIMSGSMSPTFEQGDLVIIKETGLDAINVGDIVTVKPEEFIYTHRVVEMLEGGFFRLKGDANEEPDQNLVDASQIIGRVVLVFPFGHLYTPYGFVSVLLFPAALIIGKQMYTIHQFTKRRNKKETMRWRRKNRRTSFLGVSTLLLAMILIVSITRIIVPQFIGGSSSYFSDTERGLGLFSAGIWKVPSEITCSVSPVNIQLGQNVTISGSIDPARSTEVTIEHSRDGGSWTLLATTTSNADGSYEHEWEPTEAGSYEIKASWEGDDSYFGDSSGTVTISVEETP